MQTNPVKRLLMEEDGRTFSASNTDFYHLTTGQALQGMKGWTNVGNMILRGGKNSTYTVIGGLRHVIEALADFRFDKEFIEWAKGHKLPNGQPTFDPAYLDSLMGLPFNCEVSMMPDGSVAFPGPIGRVKGDPIQGKWIDTVISDFLRRGSSIATKAARLKWVADNAKLFVADNAFRRSNDTGGLLTGEITTMIGLVGTSHMRSAMANGVRAVGTMDHWYVMLKMAEYFDLHLQADANDYQQQRLAQQHAFRSYVKEFPAFGALLLDTLSVKAGIEDAIIVLKEFPQQPYSVRIDSGDLASEAKWCRHQLDAAGLSHVTVALSGGLRAVNLESLKQQGAPFVAAGIGEYFQFGGERQRKPEDLYEAPVNVEIVTKAGYAESVSGRGFKLIKLSETAGKASRPGILDRFRLIGAEGQLLGDVEVDLFRQGEIEGTLPTDLTSLRLDTLKPMTFAKGTQLQRPIVPLLKGPKLVDPAALEMSTSRKRFEEQFNLLPDAFKPVNGSHSGCPAGVESAHYDEGFRMVTNQQVVQLI